MPLTLITGRANAGKTGRAYGILREALAAGEPAVLIVPNHMDERRARRELGREYPIGLRIQTFDNHISSLWESLGDGRRMITPAQRTLLASAAARSVEGAPPGLSGLLEDLVRKLADAAGSFWRDASCGGMLGLAVSEYLRLTAEQELLEPGEGFGVLADRGALPRTLLVFNRFSDLTMGQQRFIRLTHRAGASVVVSLTWEAGFPATAVLDEAVDALSALGTHEHLSTDISEPKELDLVERGLFQGRMGNTGFGQVRVLEAAEPETEAENIAMLCRALVDEGIDPDRIAVTRRTLTGSVSYLTAALREVGLEVDVDRSARPSEAPLGAALLSLLLFVETGRREDLCAFLRSPYSGMSAQEAMQVEHRWRYRVVRDRQKMVGAVSRAGGPAADALSAMRAADSQGSPAAWEKLIRQLFGEAWGSPGGPVPEAAADAATLSTLVRFLNDAQNLKDVPVKARDLSSALVTLGVTSPDVERQGAIQVMSVERLQGRRFDVVIIMGLNASVFPAKGDDAISGPVIRQLFASVGVEPPVRGGLARERMLFYDAITRPRQRLVLSRAATSHSGETQPSAFWFEFFDLYLSGDDQAGDPSVPKDLLIESNLNTPRHELRALLARCGTSEDKGLLVSDAAEIERRARLAKPVVIHEQALEALGSISSFSPSALETYTQCPYRWFLDRYLSSKDVDRDLDARVRGSVAHAALRRFYQGLEGETGLCRLGEEDRDLACEQASQVVDDVLADWVRDGEIPESWANRLRTGTRVCVTRRVLADTACLTGFRPSHFEWDFSEQGPIDVGGLLLRGRIDRVDIDERGHAVVVDYKLGGLSGKGAEFWEREGLLQMPLYLAVVREKLGLTPVAGLYATLASAGATSLRGAYVADMVSGGVSASGRTQDAMDIDEFERLIEDGLERARRAADGMRAGVIDPTPGSSCEWCGFASLCQAVRA